MHPLVIKSFISVERLLVPISYVCIQYAIVCNAQNPTQASRTGAAHALWQLTSSPHDEKPVFFFNIFFVMRATKWFTSQKNSLHVFFWSKFSRQMRVYQAHISQNKLEIAHLQLDLDWCNRRLLRIMGVAGSRKGKGSRSSAVLKCCWNLFDTNIWNYIYVCVMCIYI